MTELLTGFFILMVSLSFHEFAHAWTAWKLGDDTAEKMGRLSLNPLAHLDLIGTLALLMGPFGWAKPVPVDPGNLKNPRTGTPLISLAGPLSNILLAVAACGVFYAVQTQIQSYGWTLFLRGFIQINFSLALFNLIPVFPLDGSKLVTVFLSERNALIYETKMQQWGAMPLLLLLLLEFVMRSLGSAGFIGLWFRFWSPLIQPIMQAFQVPPFPVF